MRSEHADLFVYSGAPKRHTDVAEIESRQWVDPQRCHMSSSRQGGQAPEGRRTRTRVFSSVPSGDRVRLAGRITFGPARAG